MRQVTKSYGSVHAVDNVSMAVDEGETLVLLGPSGCGKTTCLRLLAGFEQPDAGEISLDGATLASGRSSVPPERRGMGVVFQSYALWPHLTVFDNVAFGPSVARTDKPDKNAIRERVDEALRLVRLRDHADRYPHQLSGGQQQRVALARALVVRPRVLLLDEPLSNLDTRLREEMRFEIRRLQRLLGVTMLYVTHDQAEALSLAERIIVMNDGVIEQIGSPERVYRRPRNRFVANALGTTNLIDADVVARTGSTWRVRLLGRYEVDVDAPDGPHDPAGSRVLLSVRPADFRLASPAGTPNGRPRGEISEALFFGDLFQYAVDVEGREEALRVTGSGADRYEVGASVELSVTHTAATVVEEG